MQPLESALITTQSLYRVHVGQISFESRRSEQTAAPPSSGAGSTGQYPWCLMEKIQALLVSAAALLQDLTADKVKASELKKCAGVAFVFSYKAGLIVSFQHGQGFLLRKVHRITICLCCIARLPVELCSQAHNNFVTQLLALRKLP